MYYESITSSNTARHSSLHSHHITSPGWKFISNFTFSQSHTECITPKNSSHKEFPTKERGLILKEMASRNIIDLRNKCVVSDAGYYHMYCDAIDCYPLAEK